MKPTILSQSGHTTYGIKDFVVDTDKDIENLPTDISTGSAAISIESGNVFLLNSKNKWKPVATEGGNNSQSSSTNVPGISAASINEEGHLIITTSAGTTIDAGLAKGSDGQSFTFDDLTEEQKNQLKGESFTFNDLTEEQKEELKGDPGIGISDISYNETGNLLITLTNNETSGPFNVKGDKGDDYTLTPDDKTQIAEMVLDLLPKAEGESF